MRATAFETAGDVANFTSTTMPPGRAKKLSMEEHYAIVAYLLHEREVFQSEPLTPDRAAQIRLR